MGTQRVLVDDGYLAEGPICLQCGDRGFINALVYCVRCLDVAMHRYCLDILPKTVDEYVHWICQDCHLEMQTHSDGNQNLLMENGRVTVMRKDPIYIEDNLDQLDHSCSKHARIRSMPQDDTGGLPDQDRNDIPARQLPPLSPVPLSPSEVPLSPRRMSKYPENSPTPHTETLHDETQRPKELESDLIFLTPINFAEFIEVPRAIREIITGHYHGPWICLKEVPTEVQDYWFQQFAKYFSWDPVHTYLMRKEFKIKASVFLKNSLGTARQFNKKPWWVSYKHWLVMQEQWRSDAYKAKSRQNKANRASNANSSASVYRGGSVSVSHHRRRMEKEMNKTPTHLQLYKRCWGKKDGSFSGQKSHRIAENLQELESQVELQGSTLTAPDGVAPVMIPTDRLVQAYGGFNKKGRLPGLGSDVRVIRHLHKGCSPSQTQSPGQSRQLEDFLQHTQMELAEVKQQLSTAQATMAEMLKMMKETFGNKIPAWTTMPNVPQRVGDTASAPTPGAGQRKMPPIIDLDCDCDD